MRLPLFIGRDLGTSQSICRGKNFSYHICYENIGRKNGKILTSQETVRSWTDRTEQYQNKNYQIK